MSHNLPSQKWDIDVYIYCILCLVSALTFLYRLNNRSVILFQGGGISYEASGMAQNGLAGQAILPTTFTHSYARQFGPVQGYSLPAAPWMTSVHGGPQYVMQPSPMTQVEVSGSLLSLLCSFMYVNYQF